MTSLAIDPASGGLLFSELNAALPALGSWAAAPAEVRALAGPDRDMKTGWIWRRMGPLEFAGKRVLLNMGFHRDRLEMVHLYPDSDDDIEPLKNALAAAIGLKFNARGEAKLRWGEVYYGYDPRSCSNSAGIRYRVPWLRRMGR